MIEEIQRRPFVRPLLIWIAGILAQVYASCVLYSGILLIPVLAVLLSPVWIHKRKAIFRYDSRWLWGVVFAFTLLFLSIQVTSVVEQSLYAPRQTSAFRQWAEESQMRMLEPLTKLKLSEEEYSALAAITIGYRGAMNKELKRQFSITGVTHLLSVSGFHVAIVCAFLSLVFGLLPKRDVWKWIRYISMLILIWTFTVVSGMESPAVRSALMLTFYQTGQTWRRTTDGYNTLAASAFCMLVYDPFYLFDIGFQLSYLAVYSILYLQPKLNRLIIIRNPLLRTPWEWITVSLSAQTGTAWLCLYYFMQFSNVFLLTNIPLAFLSTLLIPSGLLYILLPSGTVGYDLLASWVELLTHGIIRVVELFSRVPGAASTFRIDTLMLAAGYLVLFFLMLYHSGKRFRWLLLSLLSLLFLSCWLVVGS